MDDETPTSERPMQDMTAAEVIDRINTIGEAVEAAEGPWVTLVPAELLERPAASPKGAVNAARRRRRRAANRRARTARRRNRG